MSNASYAKARKDKLQPPIANIKVVGVGGGGGNAVSRMSKNGIRGVEFIAVNTDHQDLDHCEVRHKIYIGRNLTRGLGAGMNPELGRQAAEENRSEIAESLSGSDLVFITAGLGGGTGTGATPIVAEAAKQAGALTFAVVTKPFVFEGVQRERIAQEGIARIKEKVDGIIVVPNDRVFSVIDKDTPIVKAFESIDEILRNAIRGLVDLIMMPGIINVDFADIKSIVSDSGLAIVGMGTASGQDRATKAAEAALHSPLLELSPEGAKGVVIGISGGKDLKMSEVNDAAKLIAQSADPGAKIIFGAYYDKNLKKNFVKVTLIATGFNGVQSANSLFGSASHHGSSRASVPGDRLTPLSVLEKREEKREYPSLDLGDASRGEIRREPTQVKQQTMPEREKSQTKGDDSSYWDIPTFLRKKRK
ncbi:MAG: cell division protein FtsZ [Patescibacteria group bacterium]